MSCTAQSRATIAKGAPYSQSSRPVLDGQPVSMGIIKVKMEDFNNQSIAKKQLTPKASVHGRATGNSMSINKAEDGCSGNALPPLRPRGS